MEAVGDPEFSGCLNSGKLRRFPAGPEIAPAELAVAAQDLAEAERTLAAGGWKWATVQAYYAMFHTARALVYSRGFRERSHRCLVIALRVLFVATRELELEYVEGLESGKTLRENADYYSRFSEAGAAKSVGLARAFLARARKLTASGAGGIPGT